MSVNRTGNGGFCTVQGAFDAVPANNTAARTITVAAGKLSRNLVPLRQEESDAARRRPRRHADRIPNNESSTPAPPRGPLFFANATTGLSIENLTIYNTNSARRQPGRGRARRGRPGDFARLELQELARYAAPVGASVRVTSYVEGNVDFVWGTGVTYFDRSEIKTVGRAGAIVQARNSTGYGYVFVDSKLTAGPTSAAKCWRASTRPCIQPATSPTSTAK